MSVRNSTIEKFQKELPQFKLTSCVEDGSTKCIQLECNACKHIFKRAREGLARTLNDIRNENDLIQNYNQNNVEQKPLKTLQCKSSICKPLQVTGDCQNIGDDFIQCNQCELKYYMTKKVKYFQCYCKLITKRMEHHVYKLLHDQDLKLSREGYWNKDVNNHKCDIIIHTPASKIFVEIDDTNHRGHPVRSKKDEEFNSDFQDHRKDDEYLIRLWDFYLNDPDVMKKFYEFIANEEREPFLNLQKI